MRQLPIKRLHKDAVLPQYMSEGAAAMDVCACLEEDFVLAPGQRALISTGFAIAAPQGTVALLFARSGLAYKSGIALANSVGVVDSDYRGEVKVALVNQSDVPFTVTHGMRIAQLALMPVEVMPPFEVEDLDETARSSGGFGSTGV
ncbi:MAG: dUTP diphosphatase [Clostridia bacterium]|nr:dUTP diphosphatase [Clostridia bacterium]